MKTDDTSTGPLLMAGWAGWSVVPGARRRHAISRVYLTETWQASLNLPAASFSWTMRYLDLMS
jgi:hypothetical protein